MFLIVRSNSHYILSLNVFLRNGEPGVLSDLRVAQQKSASHLLVIGQF